MIATSGGDTDGGNSASGGASGGARGKDRDAVTVPRNTVEEFMAITDGQILVKDYTQSGGWEVAPKLSVSRIGSPGTPNQPPVVRTVFHTVS